MPYRRLWGTLSTYIGAMRCKCSAVRCNAGHTIHTFLSCPFFKPFFPFFLKKKKTFAATYIAGPKAGMELDVKDRRREKEKKKNTAIYYKGGGGGWSVYCLKEPPLACFSCLKRHRLYAYFVPLYPRITG